MERNTRQRTAIRAAIAEAARPLLPQEVLDAAQQGVPGLSIATVYRNLKAMLDEGELHSVVLPGENARYELAGAGHHHHFQCVACQKVFEVHACPGDLAALAPPGFTVEDHDLTLYGHCSDCAPRAPRRGRATAQGAEVSDGAAHEHGHSHAHAAAAAPAPKPTTKAAKRSPR